MYKIKTVVITGSARGLGFEMAKVFKSNNINVVISDLNEDNLEKAKNEINKINTSAKVEYCVCDVTKSSDIIELIKFSKEKFNTIDIWINNATRKNYMGTYRKRN